MRRFLFFEGKGWKVLTYQSVVVITILLLDTQHWLLLVVFVLTLVFREREHAIKQAIIERLIGQPNYGRVIKILVYLFVFLHFCFC